VNNLVDIIKEVVISMLILNNIKKPDAENLLNSFSGCRKVDFQKNEFLFHLGDKVHYIDLLIDGELQVFKYDESMNEVTLNFFKPVCIVAEWAVLQGIPYPASGRFSKSSSIIRMPTDVFQERLNNSIALNHIMMYALMDKIYALNNVIDRGLTMDSFKRVTHFLAECSDDYLLMKQNQLAPMLYLRPETFSRILRNLKNKNLLDCDKGKIIILDRNGLRKIME